MKEKNKTVEERALELYPDDISTVQDVFNKYARQAYIKGATDSELRDAAKLVVDVWRGNDETTTEMIDALIKLEQTLKQNK